ncbi:MAG: tape measure protein [Ruminococcus sp.]|nr:tape measure protein [Ruminococcus sp.]
MASIRSQIELYDNFTAPMMDVINSVNMGVSAMDNLQSAMNEPVAANGLQGIENEINQLIERTAQLEEQIKGVGDPIDGNINKQKQFNNTIQSGANNASNLVNTVKRAVAAYASIQTVKSVIDLSDEMTQTTARLNMMNDKLQSTQDLTNMVYIAAQRSRGSFQEMAGVVARFGNNAKSAFDSSAQVVAFSELVQKQMTIAGASTTEASAAMLQLSQALGSGVLRGDELNSIFEQAPNLIQNIADYLNVDIGKIREMAAEGQLTADIVKNAIFAASDDINQKFESMPMTWCQVWQSMTNTAIMAFQPVLQKINDLANNDKVQLMVNSVTNAMATVAGIVLEIFEAVAAVGGFIYDNWSIIEPLVMGIVAAMGLYCAVMAISTAVTAAKSFAEQVHAASLAMEAGATFTATAAQYGLNAALMACPITWIIIGIIALIAVIYAVCAAIAKMTGAANTGFGIITGGVNVVIQFFKNLGLEVANIAVGIWNSLCALCNNMVAAFHNAISGVKSSFYNLLSTAMSVISKIANALSKLPFVEFDASGLTSAAHNYASKAQAAASDKYDYQSVSDAFHSGMNTFSAFESGWAGDAFKSGAAWGDGVSKKLSGTFSSFTDSFKVDIPNESDYASAFDGSMGNNLSDITGNTGDTAGSADKIADSMDITEEELKYLRDIAEKETVNRYTTAQVNIDMSGMKNSINSGDDIDGVVVMLTDAVNEAVDMITEGVHT